MTYSGSNPYLGYGVYPQGYRSTGQMPFGGGQTGFPPVSTGGPMPPGSQLGQGQFPPTGQATPPQLPGMLPLEASYIENILRLNKGKLATAYLTFENNPEWGSLVVKGIIEAAGRDHVILSDPQTGKRYLLLMVYLNYVTFDEEIEYEYPFTAGGAGLSMYQPR